MKPPELWEARFTWVLGQLSPPEIEVPWYLSTLTVHPELGSSSWFDLSIQFHSYYKSLPQTPPQVAAVGTSSSGSTCLV